MTAGYGGDAFHGSNAADAVLSVSSPASVPRPPSTPAPSPPHAQISGTARAGGLLSCPASAAAHPSYLWARNGSPIAGAYWSQYRVQTLDEGTTLTCVVTVATTASSARPPAVSASVTIPVPVVSGCPAATGGTSGTSIGLVGLGMTRSQARRAYARSRDRASASRDVFCLTPLGIEVGYGGSRTARARVRWIVTGNAAYSIHGIRPGAGLADAAQRLKLGKALSAGPDRWYLVPAGATSVLLQVRGGVVEQIGLASTKLTRTRAAERSLVRALQQPI